MKIRQYVILAFLLFISAKYAWADKGDTAKGKKSAVTYSFTQSMFAPGNIWAQNGWQTIQTTDTTLNNFEIYNTHYNLGNTGLPYVPVFFNADLQPVGFYYGQDYIRYNFYSDSSVRYYNTRAPYTQFYYVSDPQIHQYFRFTHAQNFGKHLDVSIGFKRIRSEGNYLNQSTNLNQLSADINYHTKHYLLFADILYDVSWFDQNGGIASDTELASSDFSNRQTAPVNLNYARTSIYEQSFHLQQYYFFGFKPVDSSREKPRFYLSHAFRIAGHSNVFMDNNPADSLFYQAQSIPMRYAPLTYDSTRYTEIDNDLSIGSGQGWNNFLRWAVGLKDQWVYFRNYVELYQNIDGIEEPYYTYNFTDTIFNNVIAHARIYNAYDSGRIIFDASGQYIAAGNQQGNKQGLVQLGVKIDSLRFIKLSAAYSYQDVPFIYDLYEGNNLYWLNPLANTTTIQMGLTYYDKKWKLGITLQAAQISGLAYFNYEAMPQQYQPAFNVYTAGITKDFKLYKFHWVTFEKLQYVADSVPLRLPRLVTENSVFFETPLFHHALDMRLGADLYYNTSYYGYAYMPVTDQYYLENSTQFGNYLYVDPFVSFHLKTFRIFVKLENSTEGLTAYNYYYALHYPMPDRTLRFGIAWDFWN